MKKIFLISAATLFVSNPTFAGDYLTNTNQHTAFLRMIARGASIDIDGVYYNPAGLAFLPKDGLFLSLTNQSAYQTRNINSTSSLWTMDGKETTREYKGKASAPILPSLHAAYKKGNWVISGTFAVVGGGGKASFNQGLPMFDAAAIGLVTQKAAALSTNFGYSLTPDKYNINTAMEGRQFIYGFQLGLSYRANENFSVFAGARMNYFNGGYKGFLNIGVNEKTVNEISTAMVTKYTQAYMAAGMTQEQALAKAKEETQAQATPLMQKLNESKIELDCDQTGWGLTPIIGIDAKFGKLNLAAKYEFKANMNIENDTHTLECPVEAKETMAAFENGVNTPNDIPSMLAVAAGYEFLPCLRASLEYHFFDDKQAGMANDKQKALKRGTHEYLGGIEWDATKQLTLSGGFQKTCYGLSDEYQGDTSFSCNSYSLGFGGRIKLSDHLSFDIAYFWTTYKDYTKSGVRSSMLSQLGLPTANDKDVYSRTNKVFGASINYKF